MATASKAPAASTPKNTIPAAPTPSPRPMGRPFSHKSPATKTPASLHGHSHNVSTSSHPSSTPLAAPAFGEDALAYNSPAAAALIASIGSQGLTPLLNGQEGLGLVAESQVLSTKEGSVGGKKNTEEEKLRNLQEAQRLLKTRSAGRTICRESVEKVVQQSTLNFAWLDDNLSVAGNYVDLEIVFDDTRRDLVRDVVLKITTSGVEEHKKDSSAVLQKDLDPSDFDASAAPWKSLEAFSANLARLAHLDHLSQHGLNCFEAVDGLYHSFQRIWAEEKKRLLTKHVLSRICEGTLGRPAMHKKGKLGLSLDYWVENRRIKEAKLKPMEADAMDIVQIDSEPEKVDSSSQTWLARIGCESGYPPIRVSRDWLGEEVFPTDNADNNSNEAGDEARKPRWLSPEPTLVQSPNGTDDVDEMVIEAAAAGVNIPKPPNIRFTFELEPAVWLPNSAISNMMTQGVTFALDFSKASTYEEALRNFAAQQISPQSQNGNKTQLQDAKRAEKRWTRDLTVLDKDGLAKQARHSYAVHYSTSLWAYPMQSFSFGHPRQLTEAIPVLRQYALLWSVMRKLTSQSDKPVVRAPAVKNELQGSQQRKKSREPQKKSNIKPPNARLGALLDNAGLSGRAAVPNSSRSLGEEAGVPIDVSLNMTFTNPTMPMPKLDLLFPLHISSDGKPPNLAKEQRLFGTVSIEIGMNGKIAVSSTTGLPFSDSESLRKMANVLTVSEDLGVLVQWVLGRL